MRNIALFILLILSFSVRAQLFPREGNKLSWRIVGFLFPAMPGAAKYDVEIATGTYNTDADFERNITTTLHTKKNEIIGEVPSFGAQYTWRAVPIAANGTRTNGVLHHFSTRTCLFVDPANTRLKVLHPAEKYKDAYVFVDGNFVLYDMKGNPVWFLPGSDQPANQAVNPRDLKVTPQGTITFLTGGHPYEIDYNGTVLWAYKDLTTPFHHEFTRMSDGNYLTMGFEDIQGHPRQFTKDTTVKDYYDSAGYMRSKLFSSIMVFDAHSNLLWRWSGAEYEKNSDLNLRRSEDCDKIAYDLHENSVYFDEKNKIIYLSCRNINRIIKIKYPEGTVLGTYGTIYTPGTKALSNDLFSYQHCVKKSADGNLYLFNNNAHAPTDLRVPTLLKLQEPAPGKHDLKKLWEYKCFIESPDSMTIKSDNFHSGGSVQELPDGSILAMMGDPYSKIFIVDRNKKELWSALASKYDPKKNKWVYGEYYRASMVTRKELERLIWNAEKK